MPTPALPISARLLLIGIVLCFAARGTGDAAEWLATGTSAWNIPANWSGSAVPTASDIVSINNTGTAVIPAGTGANVSRLVLGNNLRDTGAVLVDGGTLNIAHSLAVGAGGNGALTIAEGALVRVTGANGIRIADYSADATGTLVLAGGALEATQIIRSHSTAAIVFAGGTLRANENDDDLTGFDTTYPAHRLLPGFGTLALQPAGMRLDTAGHLVVIENSLAGSGGVTKLGAGTLLLAPNSANTYSGATSVQSGTLIVRGTLGGDGGGDVHVAPGGVLVLDGTAAARFTGTFVNNGLLKFGVDGGLNYRPAPRHLTVGALAGSGTLRVDLYLPAEQALHLTGTPANGTWLTVLGSAAGSHSIELVPHGSEPGAGHPPLAPDLLRDLVVVQGTHAAAFSGSLAWGGRHYSVQQQAGTGALLLADDPGVPWLVVDKIILGLPQAAGTGTASFSINTNAPWSARVNAGAGWLAFAPASGNGNTGGLTAVTLAATEDNNTGAPRHAEISISAGAHTRAVIAIQRAATASGLAPETFAVGAKLLFLRNDVAGIPYCETTIYGEDSLQAKWDFLGGWTLAGPPANYRWEYEPTGDTATFIFNDSIWMLDFSDNTFHEHSIHDGEFREVTGTFLYAPTGIYPDTGDNTNGTGTSNASGGGGGGCTPLVLALLAVLLAAQAVRVRKK